ncbi:MAG: hypothetical protein IPG55_03370 [Saprospiraceae bacterium]|jgi:hypothetical protein|nr:hypothetical protein [Candidatus Defluviibacterium haderslevense]MBK7244674.1 hypothetical protein [Candidatus Defluviibacterium haderslevense]
MGRQIGLIKISGKFNDLSFYKSKDGYIVRTKGGASKARIKTDPAFARTRENNQEFTEINHSGKWIRTSFRNITANESDALVVSRMVTQLSKVIKLDTINLRGSRKVGMGLSTIEGKKLLKGFNFNMDSILSKVLKSNYQVDIASGVLRIPDFMPQQDLICPASVTHCKIESAWSEIDFASGVIHSSTSPAVSLVLDQTKTNVVLSPAQAPTGVCILFIVLKVSFFQEINGVVYLLNIGGLNAMELVAIV